MFKSLTLSCSRFSWPVPPPLSLSRPLTSSGPLLNYVQLSSMPQLTDGAFSYLGERIVVLDVLDSEQVSDKVLSPLLIAYLSPSSSSLSLSIVTVSVFSKLVGKKLSAPPSSLLCLFPSLPGLSSHHQTDVGIVEFSRGCPSLSVLDLPNASLLVHRSLCRLFLTLVECGVLHPLSKMFHPRNAKYRKCSYL